MFSFMVSGSFIVKPAFAHVFFPVGHLPLDDAPVSDYVISAEQFSKTYEESDYSLAELFSMVVPCECADISAHDSFGSFDLSYILR